MSRCQHHATSPVAGRQPRVDTSPCRGWRWSQHPHHYSTTGPPRRRHPADGAPAPGTLPVAGQQSPARRRGAHMVTAAPQLYPPPAPAPVTRVQAGHVASTSDTRASVPSRDPRGCRAVPPRAVTISRRPCSAGERKSIHLNASNDTL